MKFKIHEEKIVLSINIFGKPAETETRYYIYRPIFFGLFKLYVYFSEFWKGYYPSTEKYWEVAYSPQGKATYFSTQEDAQGRLDLMYSKPDLFIRRKA